jgi:parallel beta-helix repeat protein
MIPPQGTRGIGGIGGGKSLRTASRIVAASNSLDKSSADYVCDGVHDEEEINKAISDLADVGGTVLLLEGTYNIGSAGTKIIEFEGQSLEIAYGIYITSNVSLVGQGKSTILILDTNNFDIGNALIGAVIFSDNTSGIEISHVTINSNQQSVSFFAIGIFMSNVSNSGISCCNIQNAFYGVFIYLGSNCMISDNVCIISCINVIGDSNIISRNLCIGGIFGVGVAGTNNQICNNTCCCTPFGDGVCIDANFAPNITTSNNHVYGNICYMYQGCDASGIQIRASDYNSIIGNICYKNTFGIQIENSNYNSIIGNICCMNIYEGIDISGSNNIILDNLIQDNRHGIALKSPRGGQALYNTISNNVIRQQRGYGIHISTDCIGTLVINNDLYQSGSFGDLYNEGDDTVYHSNRTSEGWIP